MRFSSSSNKRRRTVARRQMRIEHLEARCVLNGQAVLANDTFLLRENGPQVGLNVLANDVFGADYQGQRLISSVSYGSEGGRIQVTGDRRGILYTPPADFFGTETFVYAVDGQYTAQVQVSIEAPLAFDHYTIPPDGQSRVLDLMANDPFWSDYTGPRRITAVSVGSKGGAIEIAPDRKSIRYTPPDEEFGTEIFTYVVDDFYSAQVTISVPSTLFSDLYEMVKHEPPCTLDVLANDPFWAGYTGTKRISHVTPSQIGATIAISSDGRSLIYTQPHDFGDHDFQHHVYDTFRYVVDGTYEAEVRLILYRPVRDDAFEVDANSRAFFFNVTLNDRYGGAWDNAFDAIDRVTSVTQSEHGGTITISADGQGVFYTPAAGFSGVDTFTYTADGVHVARVHVNVTRPVRDDGVYSSVYQDTPNNVLDVLANDFLGNGYVGPRLITLVGATEHGGTVAIRNDGKAILYTPAAGYVGEDRFTYTVDGTLEASVTLNVAALAQPDHITAYPEPSLRPYLINVLANDYFGRGYAGAGVITAVELVDGGGAVSVQDGRTVVFNPTSAESHTIRYIVDGQYQATVSVFIYNVAYADQAVVDQNSPARQIDVLWNDFYISYPPYSYQGPRQITGITQSQHGGLVTLAADGRSVYYQPPADFHGQDTFTYTVDDFMTATVTINVIRRVRDDQFRVDVGDGPQTLRVLVNDLFGANYAGPGQITGVTSTSSGGTVTIGADHRSIVYTPRAGFVGTDTFTYTVDGALKAEVRVVVDEPAGTRFPTFASVAEYTQFLVDDALERYQYMFGQTAWNPWNWSLYDDMDASPTTANDRSHSETNVQVAGVDEGDIIEFDADYLYMLTSGDLVIVNAWPAEELSIASRFDIEGRPIAEFLNGDRLTIISEVGGAYQYPIYSDTVDFIGDRSWLPYPVTPMSTIVTVIDVSDHTSPTLVQRTEMEGRYVDSRAVDGMVYVLVNNSDAVASAPLVIDDDNDPETPGLYETREQYLARVTANSGQFVEGALPNYTTYGADGAMARTGLLNLPEDIYQPLVPGATNLISVVSFNSQSDEPGLIDSSAVYSTGAGTIYASLDNFYVFDRDTSPEDGAVTRIIKFDWDPATGGVKFVATTAVAGTILNQFSADESGDHLRIATTVSNHSSGNWSGRDENMLFVLEEDGGVFEFVGSLQNLALDETMRSVRFLGSRAFVTTFRNIDPLFAIDLSDPLNPESVGHITLPGFTSYMHLVDQNHLLTVGRNTPVGTVGPTQVSLFDITDLLQPRRLAEYTFERFSMSEAELDHHAFGFYAEHGLLAMPVARSYVVRVDVDGDGYRETRQTAVENQLAVFSVDVAAADPSARLLLAGEIEHGSPVRRSGYIGDKLYSIANDSVKVVDVSAPGSVIAEVSIPAPSEPGAGLVVPFQIIPDDVLIPPPVQTPPAPSPGERLRALIDRARADLAQHLELAAGAPLLVTAEAASEAPGRGFNLVFRAAGRHFLYRAGENGEVLLVQDDYEFDPADGAWHKVASITASPPGGLAGDYDRNGRVEEHDAVIWRASSGAWSLTEFPAADGNRDGTVDAADYVVWRKNLGAVATVIDNRHAHINVWRETFGSTSDLRADANGDGRVDAADYVVLRRAGNDSAAGQLATSWEAGIDNSGPNEEADVPVRRPAARLSSVTEVAPLPRVEFSTLIARGRSSARFSDRVAVRPGFFPARASIQLARDEALRLISAADGHERNEFPRALRAKRVANDDRVGPTQASDAPIHDIAAIDRAIESDFGPSLSIKIWR